MIKKSMVRQNTLFVLIPIRLKLKIKKGILESDEKFDTDESDDLTKFFEDDEEGDTAD